ncbi:Tat proofreading chaperone DmsD [Affinibrenneria salicis]|uniref:Tat proofreading chaperone DmsD n=1 Tax=Affinibrenneria salicis TaxID=2590031 RepID=A0A5J5G378_9GAMM|nr:Tat proofreading chaperone DmsD [Affinibrenneria salicis]KAA9001093.1 Tat proofreading chaperone DmsD [Affinibrenneria salicis]
MNDDTIAQTGRMLGALLYYAPDDERNAAILSQLRQHGRELTWPCGRCEASAAALGQMVSGLAGEHRRALKQDWQRLFIGPDRLPAPPWGSVYLDRESVLFGDSTLALRQWLRQRGIAPQLERREPEDHIGLMLMLAAWTAENQPAWLDELLAEHLLPWAMRYLELLEPGARHPFYLGLARLARISLNDWREARRITVAKKAIFY